MSRTERKRNLLGWLLLALAILLMGVLIFQNFQSATERDTAQTSAATSAQQKKNLAEEVADACESGQVVKSSAGVDLCARAATIAQQPVNTEGPQGPAGPRGLPGQTGDMGPVGANGRTGADGKDGANGDAGTVGASGAMGTSGATGTRGASGKDGTVGASGPVGPPGPAGSPGTDGAPGKDGTTAAASGPSSVWATAMHPTG